MNKLSILTALLPIILPAFSLAQSSKIGDWQDHFSTKSNFALDYDSRNIYGLSDMGIVIFNLQEEITTKLTKTNGLSDIDLTALKVYGIDKYIVGYTNGKIDFIENNEILPLPDLYNKNMPGSKTINNYTIFDSKAFASTDFGVMVVNLIKHEISDTYVLTNNSIQNPVYQIIIEDSTLYAATKNGIYSSRLDNPRIQIFSSWNLVSSSAAPYCDLIYFNQSLIAAQGSKDGSCVIERYQNGTKSVLATLPKFRQLDKCNNLVLVDRKRITLLDSSLNTLKTVDAIENDFLSSLYANKTFYFGKANAGISNYPDFENDPSNFNEIVVNSPLSNTTFDFTASDYGLWATPGGVDVYWDNLKIEPHFSFYNGIEWFNYTKKEFPVFSTEWDLLFGAVNPKNPSEISFSSWGSGIFCLNQSTDSIIHYDQFNSGLKNIFKGSSNYVRVGGIAIDKQGYTYMTNAQIRLGGIVVKTPDNRWLSYDYQITDSIHSQGQIIIGSNGYKWSYFPFKNPGILVWDDNKTPEDPGDDRYRGSVDNDGTDSRNNGILRLWNDLHEVITDNVYALAEDLNGAIWVGTDKGPLVYYRPKALFEEQYPIANQVNIPRNDGSGLGDYLLSDKTITTIAVDAANRKWFGTANSGIYLISEDGLTQIDQFTSENSPLPSNIINSIDILQKTGEVFIATNKGVVSFKGEAVKPYIDNSSPYVFPNPVKPGYSGPITIKGTTTDAKVKITDVNGTLVNEINSLGGQAIWNGTDFNGNKVNTGVYFIMISNPDGSQTGKTKLLILN